MDATLLKVLAKRCLKALMASNKEDATAQLRLLGKLKWLILFAIVACLGYIWISPEKSPMELREKTQAQDKHPASKLPKSDIRPGQISSIDKRAEEYKDPAKAREILQQKLAHTEAAEKKKREDSLATAKKEAAEKKKREDKLAAAKKELAAHLEFMEEVKVDYNIQLTIINRLTANKTRPVRQGTQAYKQCLSASKRIKAIEDTSGQIKAKKAELENKIKVLTEAVDAAR